MRAPRKLVLVAVGVLAALVALELALQGVAFALWLSRARPVPATGAGDRTVLCVGDSFTYGLGAADPENAYPAAAQRALTGLDGPAVRFVNLGWPGQDSARVLGRLSAQLDLYRPGLVYVLVGYNDFWRDRPAATGGDDDAFPLELRTWKLLTMVAAALRGGSEIVAPPPAPPRDAPFLGAWHVGSVFFDFRDDGTIDTPDGPFDGVWSLRGDRIVLELREADDAVDIGWRLDGERLVLEGGPFEQAVTLTRGLPGATPLDRGRLAARAGDDAAAEREWRRALEVPALRFDAALLLADLLQRRGSAADALALLAAEVAMLDAEFDPGRAVRLGDALLAAGDAAAAFGIVDRTLRGRSLNDALVQQVVRGALRFPDQTALEAALTAALARDDLSVDQRIGLLGVRATIGADADAQLDALIEVGRLRPGSDAFARSIRWHPDRFPRERFVARAARLTAPERQAVVAAYDAARAVDDATGDVLERNLRRIVETCRGAAAEPVLMTYPGGREDVAAVVRAVADGLGVGLVDQLARFDGLLATRARAELFVADGHCNDAGYTEMGHAVAEDVRARLR